MILTTERETPVSRLALWRLLVTAADRVARAAASGHRVVGQL
jgi:hypothetical protein